MTLATTETYSALDDRIHSIAHPLVTGEGMHLLEISHSYQRNSLHIYIVLFRNHGIGTSDCTHIHSLLLPRLSVHLTEPRIMLQISSPGISRRIKSLAQLALFCGRTLEAMLPHQSEWSLIHLTHIRGSDLSFIHNGKKQTMPYEQIQKIRLHGGLQ